MRYYLRENIRRYEIMARMGLKEWANETYGEMDLHDFTTRDFLETALPGLRLQTSNLTRR